MELPGVEVLALEFVEEDGRVTTRVTVVVLLGLELGVVVAELEVRAGDEVVVGVTGVGRSGLSIEVLGVLAAEEREAVGVLLLLLVLPPDTE